MIRRLLLLVLFAGAFTMASLGQEIRTVDGEKYIVHTVEAGQTLFGISRHFAVELDAITEANPGAEQGLSIGQVLLIPRKAQSKKDLKTAPELNDGELLHTVTKKETLYGIARKYGVDQEDLRRLNPDLSYGLRIGMVLRIQVARSTAAPPMAVLPAVMDRDEFHRVLPGETLYALSKQFGVSADSIKAANGGLPEGLKAGIYVRIPRGTKAVTDSTIITEALPRPSLSMRRRIAVLLPFTATAQDTAATGEDGERLASVTEAAVEFRAGMAMALDSLQAQGLNADVLVFDPVGVALFSRPAVAWFFGEKLNMRDWSSQPAIDPATGAIENQGQNFSIKVPLPGTERWSALYYFGNHGELGLTYTRPNGSAFSLGGGLRAKSLVELGAGSQTATLVPSYGFFYDRNGSLMLSVTAANTSRYRLRINAYPGLVRVRGWTTGLFLLAGRDGETLFGLHAVSLPLGLAARF